MLLTIVLISLSVPLLAAFDPGCSFSNNQCVYNVKLGHAGQCDATTGTSSSQSASCCSTIQTSVAALQGVVNNLTAQVKEMQTKIGISQSNATLVNPTNERDRLLLTLAEKEAELIVTHANLAHAVNQIRQLKEELVNATTDLNNCIGVLGFQAHKIPLTSPLSVNATYCSFETDCGYEQLHNDAGDWHLGHSYQDSQTGPREDHTYGTPKGHYMYFNPKDLKSVRGKYHNYASNQSALMQSPLFGPAHDCCIRFWYNMYGHDIRTLLVYAKVGNGLGYSLWKSYGNQGKNWHLGEVELDPEYTKQQFRVVFEATTNFYGYYNRDHNYLDDIAIDDIYVYNIKCKDLPLCPPGSVIRNGSNSSSCYTFHTRPTSWNSSSMACRHESSHSHLVSVNSREEQEFLVNTIKNSPGLKAAGSFGWYTSGNDERSEGHFDWTDTGTPYFNTYTDWHTGQPNNVGSNQNCLLLQYDDDNYSWGDVACSERHPYICEVETPVV